MRVSRLRDPRGSSKVYKDLELLAKILEVPAKLEDFIGSTVVHRSGGSGQRIVNESCKILQDPT